MSRADAWSGEGMRVCKVVNDQVAVLREKVIKRLVLEYINIGIYVWIYLYWNIYTEVKKTL